METLKIALCCVQVPFARGGAEYFYDNLRKQLIKRGHEVELVNIPFKWYPPNKIITHALIWRLLDLSEANGVKIDGVIATKFPSYLVKHENKVVYLLHQQRPAYELSNTEFDDLKPWGQLGQITRERIFAMDNIAFKESKKIFTISKEVDNRLWKFNRIRGEFLYHPPSQYPDYFCDGYGDYIFYPSRLDAIKRQALLIKALKYVNSDAKVIFSGKGPMLNDYIKLSKELKVYEKITFLGHVSDKELLEYYSKALTVAFFPLYEDYGYVTPEAFLSKKAVITTHDSGGPLEFVEDKINGFILQNDPKEIAKVIDYLYENKDVAKEMGEKGYNKIKAMNVSWDNVVNRLVGSL